MNELENIRMEKLNALCAAKKEMDEKAKVANQQEHERLAKLLESYIPRMEYLGDMAYKVSLLAPSLYEKELKLDCCADEMEIGCGFSNAPLHSVALKLWRYGMQNVAIAPKGVFETFEGNNSYARNALDLSDKILRALTEGVVAWEQRLNAIIDSL